MSQVVILHSKVGGNARKATERCGFCGAPPGTSCFEVEFSETTDKVSQVEAPKRTINSGGEELDIFDIMQRFRIDGSCELIIRQALLLLAQRQRVRADTLSQPVPKDVEAPRWTVNYNIVSSESDKWVGTGWEFFTDEREADLCYKRQQAIGNVPCKRPFYRVDAVHLGAAHSELRRLASD